jgi:hypothetical protein
MNQLTFQACVFSGAISSACRVALDNRQLHPSRLMKHRDDHHPEMALDARAELAGVKDIMNDAAKCLTAFRNDNNGKLQFCEMFLTQANVLWCSHPSCDHVAVDTKTTGFTQVVIAQCIERVITSIVGT